MNSATLSVRVAAKKSVATDITTFELVDMEGKALPPFSAGSHIDVHVADGLVRQYSLCNDPAEKHRYLIGVLRDTGSRGGSAGMHDRVQQGDVVRISAPKNHFPLAHGASSSLLLAGGIGVTPILCMAERLASSGAEFEMHYCTRSRDRTAFRDRIATSSFAASVQFHFDDEDAAQKIDLAGLLANPRPGVHLYVCGPKGFMDAALATARGTGWPAERLHYEFFSSEVAPSESDESFEVKLASSGRIVVVPKDQTVIQALAAAGIEIPTSCEQGVCGTCLTRVIEGVPDHKDLFMTPEEQALNDQFTPCCSRSKSRQLVLDI
jgi:vanillate O-demethylase ferredoxin subunit